MPLETKIQVLERQGAQSVGYALMHVLQENPALLLDPVQLLAELTGQKPQEALSKAEIEQRMLDILSSNTKAELSFPELCLRMLVSPQDSEVIVVLNELQMRKKIEITAENRIRLTQEVSTR